MKRKILINIINTQARLSIIASLARLKIDFVEVNQISDMKFKYDLFKEEIGVCVHEITKGNFEHDIEMTRRMVEDGVKTIILIEEYSVEIIDEALKVGAYDVMVLPVEPTVYENKIKAVLDYNQIIAKENANVSEEKVLVPIEAVEGEFARAHRGNYQLSLMMFKIVDMIEEEVTKFIEGLEPHFRETDVVYRYSKRRGLILCPFTEKENIVEVENKVRKYFEETKRSKGIPAKLFLYGVTYPKDGEKVEEIIKKLKDGLHDSSVMGKMKGTLNSISRDSFQEYHKLMRRKYE